MKPIVIILTILLITLAMIPLSILLLKPEETSSLYTLYPELDGLTLNDIFNTNKITLNNKLITPLDEKDITNFDYKLQNNVSWLGVNGDYFVRNIKFYEIKPTDITAYITTLNNVDAIILKKPLDSILYGNSIDSLANSQTFDIFGFSPSTFLDSTSRHFTFYNDSTRWHLVLLVPKGYYDNLEEARTLANTTSMIYQTRVSINIFNIKEFKDNKVYSSIYNKTFDLLTDLQIERQIKDWFYDGLDTVNIWLTFNALGLDTRLNEEKMLYYYNLYLYYTLLEE